MTTQFCRSIFSRAAWLIMCAGNSDVNFPPSAKPHRSCAVSPPSVRRTRPRLISGAYWTFLKYLPVPVTRKYLPSSSGQEKPVWMVRRTEPSTYARMSASSSSRLTLPPLRSSQPWSYILVTVRIISTIHGAVRIFFMFSPPERSFHTPAPAAATRHPPARRSGGSIPPRSLRRAWSSVPPAERADR